MNFKLPVLYKKLLLLAIVFGPIAWLMFTEDGQRRTDTMVLWIFGEKEIKMDLQVLDRRFTEPELKQVYPDLGWQCQTLDTPYGDRLCVSRIGVFNGIPSRYITFFFRGESLNALKINYRAANHAQLQSLLRRQLGLPESESNTGGISQTSDETLLWRTSDGLVVIKRELLPDEEASMFWLADSQRRLR